MSLRDWLRQGEAREHTRSRAEMRDVFALATELRAGVGESLRASHPSLLPSE